MKFTACLFAILATVALAEESVEVEPAAVVEAGEATYENKRQEKRGIVDASYGSYGGGYSYDGAGLSAGLSGYGASGFGVASYGHAAPISQTVTVTKPVAVPVVKPVGVPVPHPVPVAVPQPYAVHVPQPYAVHVPQPYPVYKTIHVPVEKLVPYPVEKRVPYAVPVPKPYPVHVPVYKHVHHYPKIITTTTYNKWSPKW